MADLRLGEVTGDIIGRLSHAFKKQRQLSATVAYVYISYAFRFLSPLVVTPLLARTLGPQIYGTLLLSISVAMFNGLLIEFGFPSSAVRDVATAGSDAARAAVVNTIYRAKLVIAVPASLLCVIVSHFIPGLAHAQALALVGITAGVAIGFNANWYFQGINRLKIGAINDTATSVLYCLLVVTFIRKPTDSFLAISLQCFCFMINSIVGYALMRRREKRTSVTFSSATKAIGGSFALFITRAAWSLYTIASVLLVSVLSTPLQVAYYGAGERLVLIVMSSIAPLNQSIFPLAAKALSLDKARAQSIFRASLMANLLIGVCSLLFLGALSYQIVNLLYGVKFAPAYLSMAVLSVIIPISAINQVLSSQILVLHRMDRHVSLGAIIGGVLNVLVAMVIVPELGAVGMSVSRVIAEAASLLFSTVVVVRYGLLLRISKV